MKLQRLNDHPLRLGEGVIWDERRRMFHYVDIEGQRIFSCREDGGIARTLRTHDMVGCILLDGDGALCYPMPDGLYRYVPETGENARVYTWEIPAELRFNDGKAAPDGAFFVGAMYRDQSAPRAAGGGCLYRFTPEMGLVQVRAGMSIPNGLCWTADGRTMYHIDTATHQVMAYDYDPACSAMGAGRAAVTLPEADGGPDGMTIDADGKLWVARWGGYAVTQYCPATGRALQTIPVPDRNASCCCFGGADMRTLYITTAMDEDGAGGWVYAVPTQTTGSAAHPLRLVLRKEREETDA